LNFQATCNREQGGTGLGLAIVKHIALVHGGNAAVASEVGKGSVFSVGHPSQSPIGVEITRPATPTEQ
jgi:signal transduction histidine kinase